MIFLNLICPAFPPVRIFTTGNQLGIAVAMYSTAELCKLPILGGWPSSFFLYGLLGLLFLLIWQPLATNKPRESKLISLEELAHIDGIGTRKRAATLIQKTPYRKVGSIQRLFECKKNSNKIEFF
jgi:hypothetical protein